MNTSPKAVRFDDDNLWVSLADGRTIAAPLAWFPRLLTDAMAVYGADLRMPHSKAMGNGLFELRPKGPEGIGRVFYCTQVGKSIVVLHSFVKKTQETPDAELRLARKRLKDVQHG